MEAQSKERHLDSMTASLTYADNIFASVDADLHMQRIAGGNETEVYCTDDGQYVVKVKSEGGGSIEEALTEAQKLRDAAHSFTDALGSNYTIPNYFFIARNNQGEAQPVVMQPYIRNACPLFALDYQALSREERRSLARQLQELIRRSLKHYHKTKCMPDIYGRVSCNKAERKRLNTPAMLPRRLWSFLVKRTLLRSHNLLVTLDGPPQLLLVDYDPVKKSQLYQLTYYNVRRLLFLRDLILIWLMEKTGIALGNYCKDS